MSGGHQLDPEDLGDHIDRLYRAACALCGSRHDAEDLVQETFVRVLRRPRLLRNEDDLGYLMRALRNTHISRLRAAARRPLEAPDAATLLTVPDRRAADPLRRLESDELFREISRLAPDFRDALIAIDLVGLSYREASVALGVPEGTVTTRLHRARRSLAAALSVA